MTIGTNYKIVLQAVLLFLLFGLCSVSNAENVSVLPLSSGEGSVDAKVVARYLQYYESNEVIPINELPSIKQSFRHLDGPLFNFGFTSKHYWLALSVKNTENKIGHWKFTPYTRGPKSLRIYEVVGGVANLVLEHNSSKTFYQRAIPHRFLFTDFVLAPYEEKQILIQMNSDLATLLPLQFLTQEDYWNNDKFDTLSIGVFAAILLSFFCVSIFQYFAVLTPVYGIYAVLILFTLLSVLHHGGYSNQYFWPNYPEVDNVVTLLLGVGTALTLNQMYRLVVDFKRHSPVFDKFVVSTMLCWFLILPASFVVEFDKIARVASYLVIPFSILMLCATLFFVFAKKVPLLPLFWIGWLSYAVGHCLFVADLVLPGGISSVDNPMIYYNVGVLLEILVLAVAISQQARMLYRDNMQAQKHQIQLLEDRIKDVEALNTVEREKNEAVLSSQRNTLRFASASHDMRQPLFTIRATLASLKDQMIGHSAIDEVDSAIGYIAEVLREVIDESQDEIKKDEPLISIGHLFNALFKQNYREAKNNNIKIFFSPSTLYVKGSSIILTRILDNLINNAIRHSGGDKILYGVRRYDTGVELQVHDTGRGIETDHVEKMLAPFEKGDIQQNSEMGFGLGLSIVKTLSEERGYTFSIRSEVGKGSIFSVFIPH